MNNDLGQLIKNIRTQKHLSLRELSTLTGISRTYLNNLENGADPRTGKPLSPTVSTLAKLAPVLELSVHKLIAIAHQCPGRPCSTETAAVRPGQTYELRSENICMVPILGTIAAGKPSILENEIEGWAPIDLVCSKIRREDMHQYYYLRVQGDSMEPIFNDHDLVLVREGPVDDGQIAVVLCDEENACVKKLQYLNEQDLLMLISRNPNYPPLTKKIAECKVLGKVVLRMGEPRW
jgi:SOS-response transcriptional repressor LexA